MFGYMTSFVCIAFLAVLPVQVASLGIFGGLGNLLSHGLGGLGVGGYGAGLVTHTGHLGGGAHVGGAHVGGAGYGGAGYGGAVGGHGGHGAGGYDAASLQHLHLLYVNQTIKCAARGGTCVNTANCDSQVNVFQVGLCGFNFTAVCCIPRIITCARDWGYCTSDSGACINSGNQFTWFACNTTHRCCRPYTQKVQESKGYGSSRGHASHGAGHGAVGHHGGGGGHHGGYGISGRHGAGYGGGGANHGSTGYGNTGYGGSSYGHASGYGNSHGNDYDGGHDGYGSRGRGHQGYGSGRVGGYGRYNSGYGGGYGQGREADAHEEEPPAAPLDAVLPKSKTYKHEFSTDVDTVRRRGRLYTGRKRKTYLSVGSNRDVVTSSYEDVLRRRARMEGYDEEESAYGGYQHHQQYGYE